MNSSSALVIRITGTWCCLLLAACSVTTPESEWNHLGIWRRVENQPPTYVPSGYSASQTRTDRDGEWFVDKRNQSRVFVPWRTTGPFEREVLVGEARKVTGNPNLHESREEKTGKTVAGLALVLLQMASAAGGAGGGAGCAH